MTFDEIADRVRRIKAEPWPAEAFEVLDEAFLPRSTANVDFDNTPFEAMLMKVATSSIAKWDAEETA